jgi:hypothetical protein
MLKLLQPISAIFNSPNSEVATKPWMTSSSRQLFPCEVLLMNLLHTANLLV